MTVSIPSGRPGVQIDLPNEQQHRQSMARAINRINQGHISSTVTLTLDPNVASTKVVDSRISQQTCASAQPQTASAASEVPTMYIVCGSGSLTVFHTNSATTDRVFTLGMVG